VALGFIGSLLWRQWGELRAYEWHLSPGWVVLSFGLVGAGWALEINLWRSLLAGLTVGRAPRLPFRRAAQVWFLSNIVRYVPGNVWQFLGMAHLCQEDGIPATATFTSILLNQALFYLSALLLLAGYVAWGGQLGALRIGLPLIAVALLGLVVLQPRVIEFGLNRVLRLLRRAPLRISLRGWEIGLMVLGYGLSWCLIGAGFAALARGITPVGWDVGPRLVMSFVASYTAGYLSLLTPSGLGVRETVLIWLLGGVLTVPVATVVSLIARLWQVIGELLATGLVLLAGSRKSEEGRGEGEAGKWSLTSIFHFPFSILRSPSSVVLLLALAYAVLFSSLSIQQHQALRTHKADLGQMDLAIWNTAHGRFVQEIKGETLSTRLTDHVEPILLLVAPVFWLWDDVRALLVLQSVVLALGALPVFWLARSRFSSSNLLPLVFVLVYLLFPALEAANLADFHAIPLAVPIVLFAFWFVNQRQWGRFAVAALLLMMVKEEAALLAFMLGLYQVLTPNSRLPNPKSQTHSSSFIPHSPFPIPGLVIMVASLVWFGLATFVIIPHYAAQAYGNGESVYFQRYGALGSSAADIFKSILTRPRLVWQIATEPVRVRYLLGLLESVGFLPLLAPELLLLGWPLLLANLLSAYPAQYSGEFHYSAPLVPYFIVAGIAGAARLRSILRSRPAVRLTSPSRLIKSFLGKPVLPSRFVARFADLLILIWLLVWAIGYHRVAGFTPWGGRYDPAPVTDHARLLPRFLAQIPDDAPVSATAALYPHLSHREQVYQFPALANAEYVLLDITGDTDMHPNDLKQQVDMLLAGEFSVLDGADGYLLLKRGDGPKGLPDAFFDFARAQGQRPQYAAEATFGGLLRLVGYDVVDWPRWRETSVRFYWNVLRPLPKTVRVHPFFVDVDGTVVEDTTQRPLIALLWSPPPRWQPGETVVTATMPWFLPRQFGVGVGVLHGPDWRELTHRVPLSESTALPTFDGATWVLVGAFERQDDRLRSQAFDAGPELAVPVGARFGSGLELVGLSSLPQSAAPGSTLDVVLQWRAVASVARDYTVFVHLRTTEGQQVAQHDGQPTWYGVRPTTGWKPGELIWDLHRLSLPSDLPPGQYDLIVGVYFWQTGERLPVRDQAGALLGDELRLGTVRVTGEPARLPIPDVCCALEPACCASQGR